MEAEGDAAVAVVCRHYFGEACLAISIAEAVAGVRVAAGEEEDSAAVAVLEEVLAAVVISVEVVRVAVGRLPGNWSYII